MRLYKREIRDPKLLEEILKECQVVRIGFADEEGMMIVPVNFGYDFSVSQGIPGLKLCISTAPGRGERPEPLPGIAGWPWRWTAATA